MIRWTPCVAALLMALALCAAGCESLGGLGADGRFDNRLPASLYRVESFGLWEHEGSEGRLRVVVTRRCEAEHCFDRADLQWIEVVTDGDGRYRSTQEVASAELAELGDRVIVETITPAPTVPNPARFEIRSANAFSAEMRAVCVVPGAPGEHETREGAC